LEIFGNLQFIGCMCTLRMSPGALAYFAGKTLSAVFQLCTAWLTKLQFTVMCCSLGNVLNEPVFKIRLQFLVLVTEEDGYKLDRGSQTVRCVEPVTDLFHLKKKHRAEVQSCLVMASEFLLYHI
jgi:hypothetical protein